MTATQPAADYSTVQVIRMSQVWSIHLMRLLQMLTSADPAIVRTKSGFDLFVTSGYMT